MKCLYFNNEGVDNILKGLKTSTWRVLLDTPKRKSDTIHIEEGETVNLISEDNLVFAKASIVKITTKTFGEIDEADYEGHEKYSDVNSAMLKFQGFYGVDVTLTTPVKIIRFRVHTLEELPRPQQMVRKD